MIDSEKRTLGTGVTLDGLERVIVLAALEELEERRAVERTQALQYACEIQRLGMRAFWGYFQPERWNRLEEEMLTI